MTDPITSIVSDSAAPNLAVDVLPDVVSGTFLWDTSEWDGPDLFGWTEQTDGWVNVVCDVTRVAIQRGATRLQGVLTRTEAADCTVNLRDTDRRFDPTNNADAIHAGIPLRVRAWGAGWSEVLFTGSVDDVGVKYFKDDVPAVTLSATDVIGRLATWKSVGYDDPGTGAGDNLLQRVNRVLSETGTTGAIATDVDTSYAATLAASNLSDAWADITAATEAELGRVWANRFGKLVVRARASQLTGTVRGTLSDFHDEIAGGTVHCCYDDADVVHGTEILTNRAIAARRVPTTDPASPVSAVAQVDDQYSTARYGVHAVERRSLELQSDDQLQSWVDELVLYATNPELRVDSVSVAPYRAPAAWPQVAATDIGDRWVFRLRPAVGPVVARTLGVLGIEHDITPERWTCVWKTVDAPAPGASPSDGWFVWGLSVLDSDALLAPVGGAVPV